MNHTTTDSTKQQKRVFSADDKNTERSPDPAKTERSRNEVAKPKNTSHTTSAKSKVKRKIVKGENDTKLTVIMPKSVKKPKKEAKPKQKKAKPSSIQKLDKIKKKVINNNGRKKVTRPQKNQPRNSKCYFVH